MVAILSHAALAGIVRELVPAASPLADIRLWRSRGAGRGDVCTDAALVMAAQAGRPASSLAGEVAARLAALPVIAGAVIAGPGFVNVTFADDALARLLPRLLAQPGKNGRPLPEPWHVPPARIDLRDPWFRIQHMHARCRSVARVAAGNASAGWMEALGRALGTGRIGPAPGGARRALLCELAQGGVLLDPGAPPADLRRISGWLGALADAFEAVWDESGRHAKLVSAVRELEPACADRALLDLALMLATADAAQAGLWRHGMAAAEEIR